jgi:uncharacterized membrane protein YGL010W
MSPDNSARAKGCVDCLLDEYGESHRHPLNKVIHCICIPVIAWTVMAILWALPMPSFVPQIQLINWATMLAVFATFYYMVLSVQLAVAMMAFIVASFWLISIYQASFTLPIWKFALGVLAVAWIFRLIGYAVEGKRPSFFKDLKFLLLGPAWVLDHILGRKRIAR